jgi:hypothetical protein
MTIAEYNKTQQADFQVICDLLKTIIDDEFKEVGESKIWHGSPVWFIGGNPIVGYSKQKLGLKLMFWSGADFEEPSLNIKGAKFKDASIFYNDASEVNESDLRKWLKKSKIIQWDYKNIVKKKGLLEKIVF